MRNRRATITVELYRDAECGMRNAAHVARGTWHVGTYARAHVWTSHVLRPFHRHLHNPQRLVDGHEQVVGDVGVCSGRERIGKPVRTFPE